MMIKSLVKYSLFLAIILILFFFGRYISRKAVESKNTYKKAFVNSLYLEYNAYPKKYKELYSFDFSVEVSKYNAWLVQMQWLNNNFFIDPFISDSINDKIHFTR